MGILFINLEKSCINLFFTKKKPWQISRLKKLSKSKLVFSKTLRKPVPRRPRKDPESTKRSVLVSKPHRLPLTEFTLIKNAHSPAMFPSEVEFSRVLSCQTR